MISPKDVTTLAQYLIDRCRRGELYPLHRRVLLSDDYMTQLIKWKWQRSGKGKPGIGGEEDYRLKRTVIRCRGHRKGATVTAEPPPRLVYQTLLSPG